MRDGDGDSGVRRVLQVRLITRAPSHRHRIHRGHGAGPSGWKPATEISCPASHGFLWKIRHLRQSETHFRRPSWWAPPGYESMVEVPEAECVAGLYRGDRYFGFKDDFKGQVSFFANETHQRMCENFGKSGVAASVYRRNVVTSGSPIPTHSSAANSRFKAFGSSGRRVRAYRMNQAVAEGARDALVGFGGLRAKVLSDGWIRPGDR